MLQPVHEVTPGIWRVAKSRVSIDSVVIGYQRGESPEEIAADYPVLNRIEVEAAIAWYLENREAVDESMRKTALKWEELRRKCQADMSPLMQRMRLKMKELREAQRDRLESITDKPIIVCATTS